MQIAHFKPCDVNMVSRIVSRVRIPKDPYRISRIASFRFASYRIVSFRTKDHKPFERYRTASGLKDKSEQEQVSTLLYAIGDSADDILTTLKVDEAKSSYEEMKTALDNYFGARRNVIIERARFNRRIQRPGESIDSFIQDLYRLADECGYSTLREELTRRLVQALTRALVQ